MWQHSALVAPQFSGWYADKSAGFTLIELILVVVVLGVLAVSALPRFLSLQSESRIATLQGLQAAIQSVNTMVYAQALLQQQEDKVNGAITIDGERVRVVYGYVRAVKGQVIPLLELDDDKWRTYNTIDEGNIVIYPRDKAPSSRPQNVAEVTSTSECNLLYRNGDEGESPNYLLTTGGC